jgi:hypothetical protein
VIITSTHWRSRQNFTNQNTRGRCYDHNSLRFLPIFGENVDVFFKNQCYEQIFSKTKIFSPNFSAKKS